MDYGTRVVGTYKFATIPNVMLKHSGRVLRGHELGMWGIEEGDGRGHYSSDGLNHTYVTYYIPVL